MGGSVLECLECLGSVEGHGDMMTLSPHCLGSLKIRLVSQIIVINNIVTQDSTKTLTQD